jgi:S-layer homology domain.
MLSAIKAESILLFGKRSRHGRYACDQCVLFEFAAVIRRVIGYTVTTDMVFADVPHGEWYAEDIARLYAAGIMLGDGAGAITKTP